IDSHVFAFAVQPDGKVLIGGHFYTVNGAARGKVARLNADGTTDATFMNGVSGANYGVSSIALQSDGKVLIGGGFTTVNGATRKAIARLNPDGTVDSGFDSRLSEIEIPGFNIPPSFTEPSVGSIARQSDGKVVIAGGFTTVDPLCLDRIVRLSADGSLDT